MELNLTRDRHGSARSLLLGRWEEEERGGGEDPIDDRFGLLDPNHL